LKRSKLVCCALVAMLFASIAWAQGKPAATPDVAELTKQREAINKQMAKIREKLRKENQEIKELFQKWTELRKQIDAKYLEASPELVKLAEQREEINQKLKIARVDPDVAALMKQRAEINEKLKAAREKAKAKD